MTAPLPDERLAAIRQHVDEFIETWAWHEATDDTIAGWGHHMGQMLYRLPVDGQTDDMRSSLLATTTFLPALLDEVDRLRAEQPMAEPTPRVVIRRTGAPLYPWEARCTGCSIERTHIVSTGAAAVNTRGVGNARWSTARDVALRHLAWHAGDQ